MKPEDTAKKLGLGPTGQPCAKLGPHDHGPLAAAVYTQAGKVMINFGTNLSWVAMTPADALSFAKAILENAAKLTAGKH